MEHSLNYDKIVIGSSLEALLFAFYNKLKVLYTRNLQPNHLEYIENFGLGTSKKQIWDTHAFQLGMAGYFPFENKIKHLRYEDTKTIKAITLEDKVYSITYNNLYVFDDYNFLDLPITSESTSDEYRIIDWFRANSGQNHDLENIQQDTRFMNQVIFYENSKKSDSKRKDVCVISFVKKSELEKYPEHLVKIKTESLMVKNNIPGKKNKLRPIDLEHVERDILDLGQNIYQDFDNVSFVYTDAKLMYDFHKRWVKIDYMKYLRLKLGLSSD